MATNDGNIVKRTSQYLDNLEHDDTTDAKAVAIYGTPDGSSTYRLKVNSDGSINTSGFGIPSYDYVSVAYPTSTQEIYTFNTGGSGGTTVATVTINYTDSTKNLISNVERA